MTTIILADDHHIVRRGLRALLEIEPGFKIVGESGDGLETINLVESLKPDILVLDLMMGAPRKMKPPKKPNPNRPIRNQLSYRMFPC